MSLSKQAEHLQALEEQLRPLYDTLASHPLYGTFETLEDLHVFMEAHVFAVWDFMSLLKSLQRELTCVEVPWTPSRFPESRRLVNEIVLGEESDICGTEAMSHFELYLRAMQNCGASTVAIKELVHALDMGMDWKQALAMCGAPEEAQRFVRSTFAVIEEGRLHCTAAAFTFGREDLIPDMFRGFICDQNDRLHGRLELMRWYMERHIEVDGEEHGPMALRMIAELCGDDRTKWQETSIAAEGALMARLALWDSLVKRLRKQKVKI
jgi:hypothetical protein